MNRTYLFSALLLLIISTLFIFSTMAQPNVQSEASIYINVPKKKLWEITALQFDKIGVWSAGVRASQGYGTGQNGAVCSERRCEPSYKGFKQTTERIIDYQPEQYHFTYQIVAGLPKMVAHATNQWLHTDEANGTRLTMKVDMELRGLIGRIMKGPMQKRMAKILRENLEELKVYVETGELHERKRKLNQQIAQKDGNQG